ncbi:efflux transport transcriptional regulator TtgT [Pseudomonas asiatica]|jgi:DNA-binding IclR family transcriptional regulator|uniref:TtgT n=4 Tax=Pseudomonas putida group TaxID=136845 RepID=E0X9D2_PSEPU|nr:MULTISPECIES: efflux transport transcriptional regulator TtgT [Pseudomonas]ADI95411.1 TtgT [Pseudomonas putida DOT-T1E]AFO50112.1 regulatory protein, IclR [Pseudomonas putida DOT-T1E]AHC82472.1 transcriptional regulator [Pseudomonas monteilii SB3078]AHC87851.1 transcriptional regulator [Pseudomonas monteilii SB3101]MDD1997164.1 efflux transport transcriptional regulator TtgT [Pseudomonas putida]
MSDSEESSARHGGIQVIARAASIMRALGSHPQGLSLAAIAQVVDLPRSTVQRIINALGAEHLVEALGPSGGFRLGPAFGRLITQAQTDIISLVRPHLIALSEQVYESTCLLSLSGEKIYVLDRVVAERELRVVFPIGIHVPATAVSGGKVLLAELSEEAQQALLPDPLPVCTPRSVAREALLEQLKTIKSGGVADDHDEYIEGLCSYSVLLDTYLGHYSVSIVAPNSRATTRVAEFQQALQACKQNIEVTIGRAPREFAG